MSKYAMPDMEEAVKAAQDVESAACADLVDALHRTSWGEVRKARVRLQASTDLLNIVCDSVIARIDAAQ